MSKSALIITVSALALCACKNDPPAPAAQATALAPAPAPASAAPAATANNAEAAARKVFKTKCVVCHGDHGAGDGPGAAALNPKPRAFGDATWQASVTDDHIKSVILKGGAAVGKSAAMPPNPDLKPKPEVVAELVKIVRAFEK
jgi:mono/diheme cytochrome c family protein